MNQQSDGTHFLFIVSRREWGESQSSIICRNTLDVKVLIENLDTVHAVSSGLALT